MAVWGEGRHHMVRHASIADDREPKLRGRRSLSVTAPTIRVAFACEGCGVCPWHNGINAKHPMDANLALWRVALLLVSNE